MQHVLSLDAPETLNNCILKIWDTSVYNEQIEVSCPILAVTVPGFNSSIELSVEPGFNLNLTTCDLKLQTSGCGSTYAKLPDGIYILRYSVSPNDIVYVEYNHLRMTCALNRVQKAYCELDLAGCDPSPVVKQKLQELQLIQQYLKAAKAMVEYCHQPAKGMDIYNYALKLLNGNCSSCKSC